MQSTRQNPHPGNDNKLKNHLSVSTSKTIKKEKQNIDITGRERCHITTRTIDEKQELNKSKVFGFID